MVIRFKEAAPLKRYPNFKHWSRQNECRECLCSKKERNSFQQTERSPLAYVRIRSCERCLHNGAFQQLLEISRKLISTFAKHCSKHCSKKSKVACFVTNVNSKGPPKQKKICCSLTSFGPQKCKKTQFSKHFG